MTKLYLSISVIIIMYLLYFMFGHRNAYKNVPDGMKLLRQPPGLRYALYAVNIIMLLLVGFFAFMFYLNTTDEPEQFHATLPMMLLVLGAAIIKYPAAEQRGI